MFCIVKALQASSRLYMCLLEFDVGLSHDITVDVSLRFISPQIFGDHA